MFKKSLAVLLCLCMLMTCFIFPGFAAITGEEAAQIAIADAQITFGETAIGISATAPVPLYNEKDEQIGFLVYATYSTRLIPTDVPSYWGISIYDCIAYAVDNDGNLTYLGMLFADDAITVPEGGRLYFCDYYNKLWICDADGNITDEYGDSFTKEEMITVFAEARDAEESAREAKEMEELIESTDSVSDVFGSLRTLGFKKFISYLTALIKRVCAYVLNDWVRFPFNWDKDSANTAVDEAVQEYCEQNNCKVTEAYHIDKDYFVPNRQTYFSDGEPVGAGVCGVASWEMILGGYRDMGVFPALPDDITMYREIMAVMDDISAELQPVISNFLSANSSLIDGVVNPFLKDTFGMYIDSDFEFNSYEVIGTLDIGIALYLQQYGYTDYARRILSNLTISLPVLTPVKRTLLMNNLRNEISGWIYGKTDGKLTLPVSCGSSTPDTVLRSLERGEPAIFGCWASVLGDNDLTNHYFVIASLYKVESEIKLSDSKSIKIERNLVEVYDTWDDDSVELVDFDALYRTTVSDANTLALLY